MSAKARPNLKNTKIPLGAVGYLVDFLEETPSCKWSKAARYKRDQKPQGIQTNSLDIQFDTLGPNPMVFVWKNSWSRGMIMTEFPNYHRFTN